MTGSTCLRKGSQILGPRCLAIDHKRAEPLQGTTRPVCLIARPFRFSQEPCNKSLPANIHAAIRYTKTKTCTTPEALLEKHESCVATITAARLNSASIPALSSIFSKAGLVRALNEKICFSSEKLFHFLFVDGGGQSIICIICDCPELALGELCEAASNLGLGRWFLHIPDRLESRAF